MKRVTTRELLHHTKEVRASLETGEALVWTSHGKVVAYLQPPRNQVLSAEKMDWLARAETAGAVNRGTTSVSSLIYGDRD